MKQADHNVPVIAIDGPGGSGKGTIAALLAERLGWRLLDSGALYRLVAVAAMDRGIAADDEAALGSLAAGLDVEFAVADHGMVVWLDGRDITSRLRSEEVSAFSSRAAALPAVRAALVHLQRGFLRPPGLVADGRDMGTVIFPDARLKIFLTASAEARAKRRHKQLKEKGESVNLSRLFREIKKRDDRDRSRAVSPLMAAPDAHLIDSTELSIDEVLQKILKLLEESRASL
ncbi:MAG: (d)CMP kinase [Xanthomonadales bacterium]|nr:(d)CMP kinase [Xanthomonadales bacterium]